jgi:hypothetical protein
LRENNPFQLLDSYRRAHTNSAGAVAIYRNIYNGVFTVLVGPQGPDDVGTLRPLTIKGGASRLLPIFSAREYISDAYQMDASLRDVPGPILWPLVLEIEEKDRCNATVDPGQRHETLVSRELILAMIKVSVRAHIPKHR